jgi:hypothetical protein
LDAADSGFFSFPFSLTPHPPKCPKKTTTQVRPQVLEELAAGRFCLKELGQAARGVRRRQKSGPRRRRLFFCPLPSTSRQRTQNHNHPNHQGIGLHLTVTYGEGMTDVTQRIFFKEGFDFSKAVDEVGLFACCVCLLAASGALALASPLLLLGRSSHARPL